TIATATTISTIGTITTIAMHGTRTSIATFSTSATITTITTREIDDQSAINSQILYVESQINTRPTRQPRHAIASIRSIATRSYLCYSGSSIAAGLAMNTNPKDVTIITNDGNLCSYKIFSLEFVQHQLR